MSLLRIKAIQAPLKWIYCLPQKWLQNDFPTSNNLWIGQNFIPENPNNNSDSGLGSEDEHPAHIYGNISPLKIPDKRSLDELTKSLTIDCSSHDSCETTTVAKQIRKSSEIDNNNNIVNCSSFEPEGGEILSLLLTSQNPSRLDVMTIKRNKVCNDCKFVLPRV